MAHAFGVQDAVTTHAADLRHFAQQQQAAGVTYDRVLLDAPCSGEWGCVDVAGVQLLVQCGTPVGGRGVGGLGAGAAGGARADCCRSQEQRWMKGRIAFFKCCTSQL